MNDLALDAARRCAELDEALADSRTRLLTPALVVDLEAVRHNIGRAVARFGAEHWRPHVKTAKQATVIAALIDAGVRRFKVATLPELELVLHAARDVPVHVVVAYPLHGPAVAVAAAMATRHPEHEVVLLADDGDHARSLGERTPLRLAIDVDLGMNRTGAVPDHWIRWIDRMAAEDPALLARVVVVHGYDGHHRADERALAHAAYDRLVDVARTLQHNQTSGESLEVVTSGTHSYAHARSHPHLNDGPWLATVSPGTIVFSDCRSGTAASDLGLRQAAFVLARVVSHGPGRVTLDAGSKAITPDGTPSCTIVGYSQVVPLRASEEHLPCRTETDLPAPTRGDTVWLVPTHVCTTVNLHRDAVLIDDGRIVRGQVDARARRAWSDAFDPPAEPISAAKS